LRRTFRVAFGVVLLVGSATLAFAQTHAGPCRVLIVYETESAQPAIAEISAGLRRALDADSPASYEVFSEYLDAVRFPGSANLDRMAQHLEEKYGSTKFDAVIAVGPSAVAFLVDRRDKIAPGVPLFFGAVTEGTADKMVHLPDVKGVVSTFDVTQAMKLARQLQPDAKEAVVLTGSAPFDRSWQATAKTDLGDSYLGFRIRYVSDLNMEGFRRTVSALPADSAVLVLTIYEDADGQKFTPRDAASVIAAESTAPTYAVYDTFLGRSVLGGYMGTFEDIGSQLGAIVKKQVQGSADIPQVTPVVTRPVVDWRQLQRFGIDPDRLPGDTEVRFRTPTLWDEYRTELLTIAAVLLLQTATIAALVFQNYRRRAAEAEAATGRVELAHLSRASLLGELSGAFAHELNQPLTSILANAQAGRQMLKKGNTDTAELAEILSDIEVDDKRAAEIISQLRRLLTKGEAVLEPVDLNQIAAATMTLAKGELLAKQTKVDFRRPRDQIPVLANVPQLQQVVLNLIMNAVEATHHLPPSVRSIQMIVRKNSKRGEIAVCDNGVGLSSEMKSNAFKPFVSTKPKGLGLGLSICRSIVRAHGGYLRFDGDCTNGAKILLSLPLEGHVHEQRGISSPSG